MKTDIDKWLKEDGERFLKDVGIKRGQVVLDFGCGVGHYTIPTAEVVGEEGKVYAVDKDGELLDELMKIAVLEGIKNIEIVQAKEESKIPIENESIDVVLLYDVLHYIGERRKIIDEVHRILKISGLFSIYPKHYKLDSPLRGLANLSLEDIIKEIEVSNFYLERKSFKRLMHVDNYDKGYILNFRRL
jgi:ubiquinone/menaquinone biosynthesis C-methylase UbiE